MPKILYIEHDGTQHPIDAAVGRSVMQTALDHGVPGIVGDCGGCCSCATCHGYIDPQWLARLDPPTAEETVMIEGALYVKPNSRLTCQILVTDALDGLRVGLPEAQL